jgi:hypothetical protein
MDICDASQVVRPPEAAVTATLAEPGHMISAQHTPPPPEPAAVAEGVARLPAAAATIPKFGFRTF